MRKFNGKLEPFEHIQDFIEDVVEPKDELAELKERFAKLEKMFEPLMKYLGGNK
jgi:ubiquinone biosynthesis protein UbiJ